MNQSMLWLDTRHQYKTLLDAAALSGGDQTAIIYLETDAPPITITRDQFRMYVQQYSASLVNAGIVGGDLVVIAHTQSLESMFAFWGALAIGAIPSMFPTLTEKLDATVYLRNIAELVSFSGVKAILTTEDFCEQVSQIVDCPVITAADLLPATNVEILEQDADSIALLQHSSGTTGLQKGVSLSHRAVLNQLASYSTALNLTPDDVVVSWLPLYHDMGLIAGFILPLIQGIPLVIMSPFDWVRHPAMLLRAIDAYNGTLCWLPNFAYNHMAARIRDDDVMGVSLQTMRAFINCSEPVRLDSHQKFLSRFKALGIRREQLAVSYAMAENTFAVTQTKIGMPPDVDTVDRESLEANRIARHRAKGMPVVSCGSAIHGTEVRVIDDSGTVLPDRHVGEIVVRSDCMLTGYHNRPDLQPFTGGWYRTGDMGYLVDGDVFIIGREKDLIINAGKNIYPQDLEAIVNQIDGVHSGRCVVFGVPDEREGTELIAVVVEPEIHAHHKELKKAIRRAIAQQSSVTATYVTLVEKNWLIKTSSGKIARAANRTKWLQEFMTNH